jgi:hypothetical protein
LQIELLAQELLFTNKAAYVSKIWFLQTFGDFRQNFN